MEETALPSPLRAAEPNTFTHYSVVVRLPEIARRTLGENDLPGMVADQIEALAASIPDGPIMPIIDPNAPEIAAWEQYCQPYLGQNWLDIPWFFAETYFYRRIVAISGYFAKPQPPWGDPFQFQKKAGLADSLERIAALCRLVNQWGVGGWQAARAADLFSHCLWGNQADLSLWKAGTAEKPDHSSLDNAAAFLLANETWKAIALLERTEPPGRVDFICDNAGFELVSDLVLADYLLSSGKAAQVMLHVKLHPTFVSDALESDVRYTIQWLAESDAPEIRIAGERLERHLVAQRLQLYPAAFWNAPLPLWEMPTGLKKLLGTAHLVISKGDANYRRLLGDRHWAFTTPFATVMHDTPAPILALRTLKSEIVVGLTPEQLEQLPRLDEKWLYSGRWGVMQFAPAR